MHNLLAFSANWYNFFIRVILSLKKNHPNLSIGGLLKMKEFRSKQNKWRTLTILSGGLLLLFLGISCDSDNGIREYRRKRARFAPKVPLTTRGDSSFGWQVPQGWHQSPNPSSMRLATFVIAGQGSSAECSVILLPGGGGSALGNINRWRDQMGLNSITLQQIGSTTKRITLAGSEGTLVDLKGSYRGMEMKKSAPGSRMLVAFAKTPGGSLFVKLVGPETVVSKEVQAFKAFCSSIALQKN